MKKDIRSELLQIRVTPEEKVQLLAWAAISQMKFQTYARSVLMRGYTFSLKVNEPAKAMIVESVTLEPDAGVGGVQQKQRKHGAG
jgi:hypothetical protein